MQAATVVKPIWLDCDPGHDDAMAIILACYNSRISVLGISTVACNQSVDKVTRNALQILSLCRRRNIGVVAGQAQPLVREKMLCPEIHGESGLALRNGALPPTDLQPVPGKAVLVMFQRIQAHVHKSKKKVHLVCTGALTNAALLLILFPEVQELLEQIVVMGGAIGSGNTNPVAEFNIQVDPEAAKVVFNSGMHVVMVPLEVTHTALVTPDVLSSICQPRTEFAAIIREILLFFKETYRCVFGFAAPPMHDPCAVAYVIAPEIFKVERMRVEVETASPYAAGQTICDVYHMSPLPKNVTVAKAMDVERFWELQISAVRAANVCFTMAAEAEAAD